MNISRISHTTSDDKLSSQLRWLKRVSANLERVGEVFTVRTFVVNFEDCFIKVHHFIRSIDLMHITGPQFHYYVR